MVLSLIFHLIMFLLMCKNITCMCMNRSYNMIIIKNWWHHFLEVGCSWLEQLVLHFILRSLASTHFYPTVVSTNSLPTLTWWLAPCHRLLGLHGECCPCYCTRTFASQLGLLRPFNLLGCLIYRPASSVNSWCALYCHWKIFIFFWLPKQFDLISKSLWINEGFSKFGRLMIFRNFGAWIILGRSGI